MESKIETLLSSQFVTTGNLQVTATLTTRALELTAADFRKVVSVDDLVGAEKKYDANTLTVHSYPLGDGCCSAARTHVETPLFCTDSKVLDQWHLRVTQLALNAPLTDELPKRDVLILVNPASGSGRALQRYHEIEPMLRHSGLNVTMTLTTHAGHAQEIAKKVEIGKFHTIATVSGDGLLAEVVNGMFDRPDWPQLLAKTSIHTIPGGSGNGLAKSILHLSREPFSVQSAAFLLIKGGTRKLDMFAVTQPDHKPVLGFLTVGWALVSDIDFESEGWRCCGGARFTFTALIRLCCMRYYNAELSYLPAPKSAIAWSDPNKQTNAGAINAGKQHLNYRKCGPAAECRACTQVDEECEVQQLADYLKAHSKGEQKSDQKADEKSSSRNSGSEKSEAKYREPAPEEWIHVAQEFATIWGNNVTHPSSDMNAAPFAHFSDGCMDLEFMGKAGCCSLTGMFLGMEKGEHVSSDIVNYVKVKGFRMASRATRRCDLTIDGERLPDDKPTEVRVFRGIINVIAR